MSKIKKIEVSHGVFWVEIPEDNLRILCGTPEDSVKLLMKKGLIVSTEKNGVTYETGPNAILLCDALIQKGHITNLGEFPILQMLYRQGMMIPNHPNNNGKKPILIGLKEQVDAQFNYVLRGNYGLTTEEELENAGLSKEKAKELLRLKLRFAFGEFKSSESFIDKCYVGKNPSKITEKTTITRESYNKYTIMYEDDKIEIDLNLKHSSGYESPYNLGFFNTQKEYFAVLHSGQGDGWNIQEPSMSSILLYQGKYYLIDAGPNIHETLVSLGIGINELEGIFHTHAHDDHFCGILTLLRSDKKLKYFATKLVRHSVAKKLAALLNFEEEDFHHYFDVIDLKEGEWNDIEGLEAKPLLSPHPIETNIFQFRTKWERDYVTYGHYADLSSFNVIDSMTVDKKEELGISKVFADETKKNYLETLDLKKIDIGKGMIHGEAQDFKEDKTKKIILSHFATKLSAKEKSIGSSASFGHVDVLIQSNFNYKTDTAKKLLEIIFPKLPSYYLSIFLNLGFTTNPPGTILSKKGGKPTHLRLIVSGYGESILEDNSIKKLTKGSVIGGIATLLNQENLATTRSISYLTTLDIPSEMFLNVVKKSGYFQILDAQKKKINFLQYSPLFQEEISYHVYKEIINTSSQKSFTKGTKITPSNDGLVYIIENGSIDVLMNETTISFLKTRDFFFYEESVLDKKTIFEYQAQEDTTVFCIQGAILKDIPILRWSLYEHYLKQKKTKEILQEY